MKNIFVALALFAALGATAQSTKATVAQNSTVVAEQLTPDALAERDMKALSDLVNIDEAVKADVNKTFTTKYRVKEDTSLSADRLAALTSYVESQLATYLGDTNFAKLKANTKLYNQLVK